MLGEEDMIENLDLGNVLTMVALLIGLGIVRSTINRLCKMSEYAMKELGGNAKMVMAFKAGQGDKPGLGPALLREATRPEPLEGESVFKQKPATGLRVSTGV